MIVCTSICSNYIPKAKALAESLKKHNNSAVFVLCLLERTIHPAAKDVDYFDFVILSSELGIDNFESFMFRHSIVEASTAVKGHLFKELLRRFPQEDIFIYLDPDILVTGPFIELSEALNDHDIILTPHLCEPEESLEAIWDNEICALKHGVFNLGFFAIRRSIEAERCVNWWSDRLEKFCYADIPGGLFTDQRWMDFAPCFFDVFVLKHPGYNVAPWNLSRRHINKNGKGNFYVNGHPLRFFHFSGFDSGANEAVINKYCPDKNDQVYNIRQEYLHMIDKHGHKTLGRLPWSYDYYSNGEKIEKEHRLIYRTNSELQSQFMKPFNAEGEQSYFQFIKSKEGVERIRSWKYYERKVSKLYGYTKNAYQTGGLNLVIERTIKFIHRRIR